MHAVEVVEVICIYAHKCTICIRFLNVLEEMQQLLQQPLEIFRHERVVRRRCELAWVHGEAQKSAAAAPRQVAER